MSRLLGGVFTTSLSSIRIAPLVDLLKAGKHSQARRLAAARRPDENEELAIHDFEIQPVDGPTIGLRVDPGRVLERHRGQLDPLSLANRPRCIRSC